MQELWKQFDVLPADQGRLRERFVLVQEGWTIGSFKRRLEKCMDGDDSFPHFLMTGILGI